MSPAIPIPKNPRVRIDMVIGLIPDEWAQKRELVRSLEKIKRSLAFSAPELINDRWGTVVTLLNLSLPDVNLASWTEQIAKITREPL